MNIYSIKKVTIITLLALTGISGHLLGQISGANAFLQGRYLEIGINTAGAFGASPTPSGYHGVTVGGAPSSSLAEVYDIGRDGWTVGSPPLMGDYTLPGFPEESWSIQTATSFSQGRTDGTLSGTLTGSITGYSNTGGVAKAYWNGSDLGGQLTIDMETAVDTNGSAVVMTVKLKNTGSTAISGIYYARDCDPDPASYWSGGSSTINTIVYQGDTADRAFVNAVSSAPLSAPIGLGAKDARARAVLGSAGISITAYSLPTLWASPGPLGVAYVRDAFIALVFNVGTLGAGDSTTLTYAYIFNGIGGYDSLFAPPCSGTPAVGVSLSNTDSACTSTPVALTVTGIPLVTGLSYQWQSSPDSTSWTDISGATLSNYSFSGLTTTTYYRCRVTCTHSGLSSDAHGVKVIYTTICPCLHTAGAIFSNYGTACPTIPVVINDTTYTVSSGVSLQWESSPDSTTWTDISGATSVPYTFTGLSTRTFFRLKTTCTATGVTLYTNARRIDTASLCGCSIIGLPSGTIATASTTFCSSCSLTLDVTGTTAMTGVTYQWQRSFTGTYGWSNIPGATSLSYTHSPGGAYYYKCLIRCTATGATATTTPVYVGYDYSIVTDSIGHSADTTCNLARYYLQVNGVSSLLSVKTYFGDGNTDSATLSSSGTFAYADKYHNYTTPGTYTIMHILYHNNVPQDTVLNSYEHLYCKSIPIKLYLDFNNDCIHDSGEPYNSIPVHIQVDSNGTPIDTYSVTSGIYYRALGGAGTVYSFRVLSDSRIASCPTTGILNVTLTTSTDVYPIQKFGINCSASTLSDLAVFATVSMTDTHKQKGHIYLRNNYCSPVDGHLSFRYSFKYSASPVWRIMPTAGTTPSYTWDFPSLSAEGALIDIPFHVRANSSTPLSLGDTVVEEIVVIPTSGTDVDTTNNHIIRIDTVRAPYDPNIIEVTPPGCFDTNTIFQFTVHFENLGNDTAHNVYVLDTLSEYLDPSTMELVMSSAEVMNIYPYTEGGYNIVKFDFPNIKLLDSSWQGLNDGAFIYTIKRKPDMPDGASIFSRVGIYFDYNDVVMTNTVQNLKGCPVIVGNTNVIRNNNIRLYPNPATDELTIETDENSYSSFSITNTIGQQLMQQSVTDKQTRISVNKLSPGIYYLTLKGTHGSTVRKFVKW